MALYLCMFCCPMPYSTLQKCLSHLAPGSEHLYTHQEQLPRLPQLSDVLAIDMRRDAASRMLVRMQVHFSQPAAMAEPKGCTEHVPVSKQAFVKTNVADPAVSCLHALATLMRCLHCYAALRCPPALSCDGSVRTAKDSQCVPIACLHVEVLRTVCPALPASLWRYASTLHGPAGGRLACLHVHVHAVVLVLGLQGPAPVHLRKVEAEQQEAHLLVGLRR
mmetsp:Transcript_8944/g.19116  ORF Transcript_8944/g.19116 Transcript_8944/m.19116 type:complete len:220 (-) Transcript_8944:2641-3300(-)